MKRNFPNAAHIVLVRDPLMQWESAWRLAERGTPYFLAMPAALLAGHAGIPLVDAINDAFGLRIAHLRDKNYSLARKRAEAFAQYATMAMTYRIFLAFWLVSSLTSLPYADIAIDSDRLTSSGSYRHEIERAVLSQTGVTVNFSSARSSRAHGLAPVSAAEMAELHGLARAIAEAHDAPDLLRAKL
jgi:hypothetical protein